MVVEKKRAKAERARRIVELHTAGWTFETIAKKLGFKSHTTPMRIWQKAIANIPKKATDEARALILMVNADVRRAQYNKMRMGDVQAASIVLACNKELREVFGIDAAKKQELTGANGGPISTVSEASERLHGLMDRLAAAARAGDGDGEMGAEPGG